MKVLLRILVALLLGAIAPVQAATIEINVNGLVCAFCAQGIEKQLRKFPATADVVVSLEQKLVAVALKDGQDIPDSDLRSALTKAGYTVKAITALKLRSRNCGNVSSRVSHERGGSFPLAQCGSGGRRAAGKLGDAGLLCAAGSACFTGGRSDARGARERGATTHMAE
jgi:periplasmic mercuric ion binding protein